MTIRFSSVRLLLSLLLLVAVSGCRGRKKEQVQEKKIKVTLSPLTEQLFQFRIPVQGTVTPDTPPQRGAETLSAVLLKRLLSR